MVLSKRTTLQCGPNDPTLGADLVSRMTLAVYKDLDRALNKHGKQVLHNKREECKIRHV